MEGYLLMVNECLRSVPLTQIDENRSRVRGLHEWGSQPQLRLLDCVPSRNDFGRWIVGSKHSSKWKMGNSLFRFLVCSWNGALEYVSSRMTLQCKSTAYSDRTVRHKERWGLTTSSKSALLSCRIGCGILYSYSFSTSGLWLIQSLFYSSV